MKCKDTFSTYHPFVNLVYFVFVIGVTIFVMHPVVLGISFFSSFIYSIKLNGKRAIKFNLIYMIPMLLIAALINPLFVHEGSTILAYFYNDNPLTLESIAYGATSALMLVSVIMWFSCYNVVMTSDKFIYLFGRVIPGLSLILSMVLRFVPRFKNQTKVISNAQKCIGRDVTNGNMINRLKHGLKIISIMVTWALENGVDTADSMNARGYGLRGRTSFSNFRFDSRDKLLTLNISILMFIIMLGIFKGYTYIRFYPTIKLVEFSIMSMIIFVSFFMVCCIPIVLDIREDLKWKYLKLMD